MSRTLKDRPYWVKVNDKNLARTPLHNHEDAGKPVYRNVTVKDDKGKPVRETYTYTGLLGYRIWKRYEGYKLYSTWAELLADSDERVFLPPYYYELRGEKEGTRVKREVTLVGHRPTECTINDIVPRPNHYWDNDTVILCDHRIEGWSGGYYYCDHYPNKAERKNYHHASRTNEKNALRKLTKAVYAEDDYADADFYEDVMNKRKTRHHGWWC